MMERVEVFRTEFDGLPPLVHYELRFTEEERSALEAALTNYASKEVERFISKLEFYCQSKHLQMNLPHKSDHKAEKTEILKSLRTTLYYLDRLINGKTLLAYHRKVGPPRRGGGSDAGDESVAAIQECVAAAWPIERLIGMIEKNLERESGQRGRPPADDDDFVKTIAAIYNRHLGRPSTYIDDKTNRGFVAVVRITLNALGLRSEDPSRAVRAAVKSLPK